MDNVFYSWLGVAAFSPFITILSTWNLVVFCSYRKRWKLIDLFLLALTTHEVIFSLFGFGFAVLSVIRPLLDSPCAFMVWGLTATRTFHLAAITSLLLDQALNTKWTHTYKYSIQKGQVKYHIVVLSIIALFVGVTAVFARVPSVSNGICSLHPLSWDFKFSLFLTSVYSMLLLIGFICCLTVVCRRSVGKQNTGGWTRSGRSSRSSNDSNATREDYNVETPNQQWRTVGSISWMSYVVNHIPFLVMNLIGIAVPTFWSPWMDNCIVWTSLAQGVFLSPVLFISDSAYRNAVKNTFRQPGRIYRHLSDHSGFWMQVADIKSQGKSAAEFPSPRMMYPSSSCLSLHNPFHLSQRIRWTPNTLASLQSLNLDGNPNIFCTSSESNSHGSSRCVSPTPPTYSGPDSSCYTLLSLKSGSSGALKDSEEDDSVSITTNALDDFEFHGVSLKNSKDSSTRRLDAHGRCHLHPFKRPTMTPDIDLIADVPSPLVNARRHREKFESDSLNTLRSNLNQEDANQTNFGDRQGKNIDFGYEFNNRRSSRKKSLSVDSLEVWKNLDMSPLKYFKTSARTLPKDTDISQGYYKGFANSDISFCEYL